MELGIYTDTLFYYQATCIIKLPDRCITIIIIAFKNEAYKPYAHQSAKSLNPFKSVVQTKYLQSILFFIHQKNPFNEPLLQSIISLK